MSRNFDMINNDYIEVGDVPALDLTGDEVTLSAWIRLESAASEGKIIAKWADAGARFQYLLSTTDNAGDKCQFAVYDGGIKVVVGTTTLGTGTWFHVAGVYDGSNIRVYCQGVDEGSTAATGNMPNTTAPVRIGAGSGGLGTEDPFDGLIGHCAIWDVGLSANEVQSLASGVSPLRIRGDNRLFYAPLNGQSPELDVVGGLSLTVNGATKDEEPPNVFNPIVAA